MFTTLRLFKTNYITRALFLWVLFAYFVQCHTGFDELTVNCKKDTIVRGDFGAGRSFTCELNNRQPPTDNKFRTMNTTSSLGGEKFFTFVGCVESHNNNLMCVRYSPTKSIEDLVGYDKICTTDGNFCFRNNAHTCEWYFANNQCRKNCRTLKEIDETCGF